MAAKVSFEMASEYLRLVLPLMSLHKVPVVPLNYAVWYEYVSGGNPALKHSIDHLLEAGEPVDEKATLQLYKELVDPADQTRVETAHRTVKTLLETLASSLNAADTEVSRYEESLQQCASQLGDDTTSDDLRGVVGNLIESTPQMNEGSAALHQHLEDSRKEAETLREELDKVRIEAQTDPMTGLANRKGFENRLKVLEGGDDFQSQSHCLLIGDIDKFKSVNDNYGHIFGDKIIKVVATAFANLTKGKDLAARFGGEEFIILLPDTDLMGAAAVGESIRKAIENGRVYNPKTGEEIDRVTISIGVTELIHGEPLEDTIARADAALYRAKESGRNRVEINHADSSSEAA